MNPTFFPRLCLLIAALWAPLLAAPEKGATSIDAFVKADAAHPPAKGGVVFVGSSTIVKWTTLEKDFPGLPIIKRGFGGSLLSDSVFYADRIVIPYAPPPQSTAPVTAQRAISAQGIRLGILDNSKGNADHLLKMVVKGVKQEVAIASVVSLRKPYVSMAAPGAILDQLSKEADVVISAMAD